MTRLSFSMTGAALLLATSVYAQEPPPLRAAVDGTFAPHAFPNLAGGYQGFNIDLANGIAARLKRRIIIDAAHIATRVARDVWRRHSPLPPRPEVALTRIRARLEAFVTALAGIPIPIAPMEPPAPPTWLSRLARGRVPSAPGLCGTDGERIYLPPALKLQDSEEATLASYRVLAVQQAVRVVRKTARVAAGIERGDVREWFVFAEAVAVDCWMTAHTPGLMPALRQARGEALLRRATAMPRGRRAAAIEAEVRAWLAAEPDGSPCTMPEHSSAEASLEWARAAAHRHEDGRRYEPIEPVAYWGRLVDPPFIHPSRWRGEQESDPSSGRRRPTVVEMRRKPRVRQADEDEDDQNAGMWMIRADEPQESVEDPFGLQRPADRADEADPEGLADSLSELPEARVVRTPGQAREVLQCGEPLTRPVGSSGGSFLQSRSALPWPPSDCSTTLLARATK